MYPASLRANAGGRPELILRRLFKGWWPGSQLLRYRALGRRSLSFTLPSLPQNAEVREGRQGRLAKYKRMYNIYNKTKACPRSVEFSKTAWCCSRLLKVATHKGLLVLAVKQAEVSKGTREGLALPAPATLSGQGAQAASRLANHLKQVRLAV